MNDTSHLGELATAPLALSAVHEALALLALAALLVTAVRRPAGSRSGRRRGRGRPAAGGRRSVVAQAKAEVERLGPVVGFLAAVLVIAECCEGEGVFRAAGALMARARGGRRRGCCSRSSVLASVTTALLSLDTTVVLLTPVVVATVRANGAPPRPHLYATAHLANSASLLLPVSNLTNLLAFAVVPISFSRFAALMALAVAGRDRGRDARAARRVPR